MDNNYIERIKKVKAERKMTNETLAELTGISASTLAKILAGVVDVPKFNHIIAMADALKIPYGYLFNGEESGEKLMLDDDETQLVEEFRALDQHGRDVVLALLKLETIRLSGESVKSAPEPVSTRILPAIQKDTAPGKRKIALYADLKASAGTGQYLSEDTTTTDEIWIPDVDKTRDADFVVVISGDSMEPKFHDGDYLMVQACDGIEPGELGLFVADGESYFKLYKGDRLESLNPAYKPIQLSQFSEVHCYGRVIGKLKKK